MADRGSVRKKESVTGASADNREINLGTGIGDNLSSFPSWTRDMILAEKSRNRPIRGRILRLKLGYNPNSSSVGSGIYVLPVLLLAVTTLFGVAAGIISSAFARGRQEGESRKQKVSAQDRIN